MGKGRKKCNYYFTLCSVPTIHKHTEMYNLIILIYSELIFFKWGTERKFYSLLFWFRRRRFPFFHLFRFVCPSICKNFHIYFQINNYCCFTFIVIENLNINQTSWNYMCATHSVGMPLRLSIQYTYYINYTDVYSWYLVLISTYLHILYIETIMYPHSFALST